MHTYFDEWACAYVTDELGAGYETHPADPVRPDSEVCHAVPRPEIDLDEVDFAPMLALAEALLTDARCLAEWSDHGVIGDWKRDPLTNEPILDVLTGEPVREGDFGDYGAELLLRVAKGWERMLALIAEAQVFFGESSWRGNDQHRFTATRCLLDLAPLVLEGCKWVEYRPTEFTEEWGPRDLEIGYYPCTLAPGSRLGLPYALLVRRFAVIVGLLREIVAGDKSQRPRMTVEEADQKAQEMIATPKMKKEFFTLSKRQQAKRIGCSWGTYSKTAFFHDAVERGWLPERKKPSRKPAGSAPTVVNLSPALEASVGQGGRDEVLKRLVAAEDAEVDGRRWEDLPRAKRQALLADHEADAAGDPSPLNSLPRKRHPFNRQ